MIFILLCLSQRGRKGERAGLKKRIEREKDIERKQCVQAIMRGIERRGGDVQYWTQHNNIEIQQARTAT